MNLIDNPLVIMSNTDSNKRVLCVGLCTLDIVQVCESFPVEDSEKRSLEGYWQRGGNASNNCSVLSELGIECEFLGTLSKKCYLQFLIEDFNSFSINISNCRYYEDADTPLSTVILSRNTGSRTILHTNPNLPELTVEDFKKVNLECYKWIHFQGQNVKEVRKMMEMITTYNSKADVGQTIVISLEIEKVRPEIEILAALADVIFFGKDYAMSCNYSNMLDTVREMKSTCKPGAIIICAWGEHGAAASDSKGNVVSSPSYPPPRIIDSLGAGDTFCASVISSLINNQSLQESIILGCKIAGAKIGIKGYRGLKSLYENMKEC